MRPNNDSKSSYWLVLFFALGLPIFGQSIANVVASITSALSNHEYQSALALLKPALEHSPSNAQLWMLQGLAYSGNGDQKSALDSYKRALKIAPDYLPALEGAAQLEFQAGQQDAVPLLERILKLRPQDTTAHAMLAVLAYKNGDCSVAREHFAQSLPLLRAQPGAMQEYGFCLLQLKQTEQALQLFQEILDSRPDDPRARRALAAVQLSAGQTQNALATMQPLLNSNLDVSTLQLQAAICEANKDTPNAVKALRDAIVQDPRGTALYIDFANLAMDHQSFQAGIEMIDAGLKLQPQAAELYLARGVLYVQLADYEKAEADFNHAEQLNPNLEMGAAAQAMLAQEQNQSDPDRALATVKAKIAKKPDDAFLLYLQAAIIAQKTPEPGSSEFERGIDSAKRAIKLQPLLTEAHNVLAKYYLDAGQNSLAAQECRLVLHQNPSNQTALYHLVIALRKTNQPAEIPELLKRLAKARQDATKEEGERNRYKMIVAPNGLEN